MNETSSSTPLGIGRIIQQSFTLLFSNFSRLFPLAFVPSLALSILTMAGTGLNPMPVDPGPNDLAAMPAVPGIGTFVVGVISIILSFFVSGFLCLVALDTVIGRVHTISQYARQVSRHILPIGALGLLVGVLTGIGFVFLIVPGLYVMARFLPWIEAVVFEDVGWQGLSRAQDLTEGYRWPLVGLVLLMGVVVVGLALLVSGASFAVEGSAVLSVLVDSLVGAFYSLLIAIFTALTYARLREIKEGKTVEQIAMSIG